MRLFIAVNFSDEIKSRILEVQELLRSRSTRGNFTRPENLHLTLAFLGETPEEKLKTLCGIIDANKSPPFDILFNRTGCFTHSRKELWWIGAEGGDPELSSLKAIHDWLLERLPETGFPVDQRSFNAHVTLAREVKHHKPIVLDCPEIKINVNRVSLMRSWQAGGVLTYTELFGRDL